MLWPFYGSVYDVHAITLKDGLFVTCIYNHTLDGTFYDLHVLIACCNSLPCMTSIFVKPTTKTEKRKGPVLKKTSVFFKNKPPKI